ncbi:hypothetical protein CKO28_06660 [Rhodovibrio sodomensis]|uniref:Uncharacterized protein n=1 Tax=Rhodovibrio sodomensis TaxID=1088 RepID=A0ABS1DE83_9PROT|nr:hypothetical protein [Rhodovibrio sodomensis]MBK1667715.1 hypothetical protein [Rhodovibrio sodomensis]
MTNRLRALVEKGRSVRMTDEDREEQRRTFAYGNTHIENERITRVENERITRATVDAQAEALNSEKSN